MNVKIYLMVYTTAPTCLADLLYHDLTSYTL